MPSETDASAHEPRELPDSVVRAQLERILASEVFSDPSNCGASFRSSSNNDWPGRAIRSKNRSSPTSCTGRERTSTVVPIPSFGWTPGAFATNCASTTRADPIPSSSRCRRAATFRSSKRTPPHPPHGSPSCCCRDAEADAAGSELRRARIAISALVLVAAVIAGALAWRALARPVTAPALLLPLASYPVSKGRLRCRRTATSSPSPGRGSAEAGATDIYVKLLPVKRFGN